MYQVNQTKTHILLRAEAIKAVIDIVGPEDPLETFDRVMLVHKIRYPE